MKGAVLIALAALAGGTGVALAVGDGDENPGTSRPAAQTPPAAFTRTCDTRVEGGYLRAERRSDVVIGPLTFHGLREVADVASGDFRRQRGRYLAWKTVTALRAGRDVVLAIAPADRRRGALLYDGSGFRDDGLYRLADGDASVVLSPAPPARAVASPAAPRSSTATSSSPGAGACTWSCTRTAATSRGAGRSRSGRPDHAAGPEPSSAGAAPSVDGVIGAR